METGRVLAVEADALWVETIHRSACGGCSAQTSCGQALLGKARNSRSGRIRVAADANIAARFSVDDVVTFSIADGVLLRTALIAYGLPLVTLLAGALAAARAFPGNQDLLALAGASMGLLVGLVLVRWHGVRHRGDSFYQPVLLDTLPPHAGCSEAV